MNKMVQNLVIKLMLTIFFVLILSGCSDIQKENIEMKYSYEIYNQLLSKYNYMDYVGLIPPPPLEYTQDDYKRRVDSLTRIYVNKKLGIALNPLLFGEEDYGNVTYYEYEEFQPLLEKMKNIKGISLDTSRLNYEKNKLKLTVLDNESFDKDKMEFFKGQDIYLTFSRVVFNENLTKAIVGEGFIYSEIEGHSTLYYLRRVNNKWKILYSQPAH